MRFRALLLIAACAGGVSAGAQTGAPTEKQSRVPQSSPQSNSAQTANPAAPPKTPIPQKPAPSNADTRRKFVLDVVKSAVALPQPNVEDRLRVLASATEVVAPLDGKYAKQLAREGMQLEGELVRSGQQPPVSIMATGQVDCATAAQFVESVPAPSVPAAEQSLIGAITACPRQALGPAELTLSNALTQNQSAPRALLAAIDAAGAKSRWSQDAFDRQFSSLPKDYEKERKRAPDFAALYQRVAPEVSRDEARKAGLELLEWLGNVPEGSDRNVAINSVTGTMQQVLGDEEYADALSSNVVARDVAKLAGQPGEITADEDQDSVSVLQAMTNPQEDRTEGLANMPPSQKAKQAAAYAFGANQTGDRKLADRYLDIAFSSADDAWQQRSEHKNAVGVVQEVSEAAAQVDPVTALNRAQRLQDPTAQAIGMLAVARVVLGQSH